MSEPKDPGAKTKATVAKEVVIDEHADGAPHITVDAKGHAHHYMRSGCTMPVKVVPIVVSPPPSVNARATKHAGPSRVNSDAFRTGWDSINWGTKGGSA